MHIGLTPEQEKLRSDLRAYYDDLLTPEVVAEVQRSHPAAVLPLLAGVVGLAAAVLMMRVARGTAGTVGRYAAPAARRDAAARPGAAGGEVSERSLWDAIDEGHDPTVLPTDPDSGAEGR